MAYEVHFECVDFFFGQHIGLSAGLQCLIGESACHFEEHCSLECIVEVLAHHHLSVLEQLYGVAGLHCFYHSIGQFGAAGAQEWDFGNHSAHIQWHLGGDIDACRAVLRACQKCSVWALEVKHHVHIGAITHNAQVEHAFHRWLDAVLHFAGFHLADAHFLFHEFG